MRIKERCGERERHKGEKRETQNNNKLSHPAEVICNRNVPSKFTSDEQKQLNQSEA